MKYEDKVRRDQLAYFAKVFNETKPPENPLMAMDFAALENLFLRPYGVLDYEKVFKDISYKEGWTLNYGMDTRSRMVWFEWTWKAKDTRNLEREIDVKGGKKFIGPEYTLNEASIVKMVMEEAISCEIHEAKEFFRYRGKRTFNPHVQLGKLQEVCEIED